MIYAAAFTGGRRVPSARFRVRQYLPALRRLGVDIEEWVSSSGQYPPRTKWIRPFWAASALSERLPKVVMSHRYDAVLLQREILSSFVTLEPFTARPRILDVDDAIFLQRGGRFAKGLARICDKIICGNSYLADWFGHWNNNITIIPTAIDTERYVPCGSINPLEKPVTIGWIGTSGNYQYLYGIEGAIAKVMRAKPKCKLRIVADRAPHFRQIAPGNMEFITWSEAIEAEAIRSMDIGIMPLEESPWARGKCSFKMLQYMATGLPVVVSPVGMNAEVLNLGEVGIGAATETEWVDALIALIENHSLRVRLGAEGRRVVESTFSIPIIAPKIAHVFRAK